MKILTAFTLLLACFLVIADDEIQFNRDSSAYETRSGARMGGGATSAVTGAMARDIASENFVRANPKPVRVPSHTPDNRLDELSRLISAQTKAINSLSESVKVLNVRVEKLEGKMQ
ncbi:MAG: hypothetical protein JAZ17_09560 [Candidatus Thiodiazotropha endolucinida]|nr:hypothetical protein [Candidatus Thiodiazotropha endolucinida]